MRWGEDGGSRVEGGTFFQQATVENFILPFRGMGVSLQREEEKERPSQVL